MASEMPSTADIDQDQGRTHARLQQSARIDLLTELSAWGERECHEIAAACEVLEAKRHADGSFDVADGLALAHQRGRLDQLSRWADRIGEDLLTVQVRGLYLYGDSDEEAAS